MRLSTSMPPSSRSSGSTSRSSRSDSPSPIRAVHEYLHQPRGLHEHTERPTAQSSASADDTLDLFDIRQLLLSIQSQVTSIKEDQRVLRKQILEEVVAVREDVQLVHCLVDSLASKVEEAPRGRSPHVRRSVSIGTSSSDIPSLHDSPALRFHSPRSVNTSISLDSPQQPAHISEASLSPRPQISSPIRFCGVPSPTPSHPDSSGSSPTFTHRPSTPFLRFVTRSASPRPRLSIDLAKTPSPLSTPCKHPLFLPQTPPTPFGVALRNPVVMLAYAPDYTPPVKPASEPVRVYDMSPDVSVGHKSPAFPPSPELRETPPPALLTERPRRGVVTPYASSPYLSHASTTSTEPSSPQTISDPGSVVLASPDPPRLVISPVNSLGLEDYPLAPRPDSKIDTGELLQEMKAMFNAFKVDVEKDSEALRDRIKDLEEQLSRDKTKSKGETDNSQPAPAAADIIIPSIPPSIRLDPHRGPNAVTPRPTITVGSTGPNPWMPNSQSSPSALGPGAFTPWVSTHPVDTAVHTVHPSAPPFPPSPSSKIPPFAPGAVPGGWKAVKPQGLSRSRTTGNLGGASYPPLSPALYSNIYAGCPPSNSTPEYFERMNDPMTNLGYTTPVFASPPYGYPNQGPLRRSHTEATMLPPMPHYSAPPTTQPYPSQPAWRTYLPAPTTVQPAPAHRFSINHSIPVTGAQEPSYPITYGGAHLGV